MNLTASTVWAKGSFTIRGSKWVKSRYSCVIRDIVEDKEGNIYLATFGRGLFVYNNQTKVWSNYTKNNSSMPDDRLSKIIVEDGNIWVASAGGGAYKLLKSKNNGYKLINLTSSALPSLYFHAILKLPDNSLLLGTVDDGIYIIKNGDIKHISEEILPSSWINDAIVDDQNHNLVWVATSFGLVLLDLEKLRTVKVFTELNKYDALDINVVRKFNNFIFIGCSNGGLIKISYSLDNNEKINITPIKGIPAPVHSILLSYGNMLVGTEKGLYVFQNENLVRKIELNSASSSIKSLANSSYGVLVGTDEGIVYKLNTNYSEKEVLFDYRKFETKEVRR